MSIRHNGRSTIRTTILAAFLTTAMAGAFHAPAFAQSGSDVQSRLTRIENEIQTLSRAIFKGETPPPGAFANPVNETAQADMQLRLTQIEEDLRRLTGRVEEQNYEINRLREAVARLENAAASAPMTNATSPGRSEGMIGYGTAMPNDQSSTLAPDPQPYNNDMTEMPASAAVNNAVADPNAAAPLDAPSAGELGTTVTDPAGQPVKAGTPTAVYEEAFAALRNKDYTTARMGFEQFLKDNGDHSLAGNANYWLGETYYVQNNFDAAARIFAEGYQKFPKGSKAPDNLLKLGLSLAGMGKTKEACVALSQLRKQYPTGATPVLDHGDQEMAKLKCAP